MDNTEGIGLIARTMQRHGITTRATSTACLLFQLLVVVGLPLADAAHGIGTDADRRPHLEAETDAPCSPGHASDCALAKVVSTAGIPLPTRARAAVHDAAITRTNPPTLHPPEQESSTNVLGARAPPTI